MGFIFAMRPVIRLENGIDVLKTTGDVDALEHGGGVLYRDPHDMEIYWTFWSSRELGQKSFDVFTALIPEDVISHFDPDIDELCMVSGLNILEIKKMSRSKNPFDRLEIVMHIKECSGASSVDLKRIPEEVPPFEMVNRWGEVFGLDKDHVPIADYEDYLIRESEHGKYECGRFDGYFIGRFEDFKSALCAIADKMNLEGDFNPILFYEHDFGNLEIVSWEPETFIGKSPHRRGKLPEAPWRNLMKRYSRSLSRKKGIESSVKSSKSVIRSRKNRMAKKIQKERVARARRFSRDSGKR